MDWNNDWSFSEWRRVQVMVEVSGLTCRSITLEERENTLMSGDLTEAANGEHEMEVLLVWTNFQRELLFLKCQSFQLSTDVTCKKAERTFSCTGSSYFTDVTTMYCSLHFLCLLLFIWAIFILKSLFFHPQLSLKIIWNILTNCSFSRFRLAMYLNL